nr:Uncharacterised protein [Raoultella sp. NCTC 9187]
MALALPGTFEFKRKKLEEDVETGFLTRSGLLHTESLYENRNLLAMVHVSNYNSVKNVLGKRAGAAVYQAVYPAPARDAARRGALLLRPGRSVHHRV